MLLEALREAGVEPRVAVWDDPSVDWESFPLVLIRSTWDYMEKREQFLAWTRRCSPHGEPRRRGRVEHRQALPEPTCERTACRWCRRRFVEPGATWAVPDGMDGDVVVKPAVGAGAGHTGRFAVDDPAAGALARAAAGRRAIGDGAAVPRGGGADRRDQRDPPGRRVLARRSPRDRCCGSHGERGAVQPPRVRRGDHRRRAPRDPARGRRRRCSPASPPRSTTSRC